MAEHTVFYDYLDGTGWGECTSMHRSPHVLSDAAKASGVVVDVPQKQTREGWITKGWVHPATSAFEWRMTRDPGYRVPISEFLSYLPAEVRVAARMARQSDPVLTDFFTLLDMAAQEGGGINPHGRAAREGLGYLVQHYGMTQAQADEITDAAND
jgi:hypothetical protein